MAASLWKGELMAAVGTRLLFVVTVLSSLMVLPPTLLGWANERKSATARCTICTAMAPSHAGAPIFKLAVALSSIALALSLVGLYVDQPEWLVPACAGLLVTPAVCFLVWHFEAPLSRTLAKASLFAFLQNAMQPNLVVMYKWYKATEENCNPLPGVRDEPLPCFSPQFVGMLDVTARFAFVLGLCVYNRFLSGLQYRSIFLATQLALVPVNLLDFLWVSRLNLRIGLPDHFFALGAELLMPLVDRLSMVPLFILVAKLCPRDSQSTAFALNMGLNWLGRSVSGYLGMGLLEMLGGVEPPTFENLQLLVVIRSLTRLLPILIIPLLLPIGSPKEDAHAASDIAIAADALAADALAAGPLAADALAADAAGPAKMERVADAEGAAPALLPSTMAAEAPSSSASIRKDACDVLQPKALPLASSSQSAVESGGNGRRSGRTSPRRLFSD